MKKWFVLMLLSLCGVAQAAETITATVNGMVCAFCAQGIEKKARALPATEDVYVNLQKKVVAVQVKEGAAISGEEITALVKEAGYDVTSIEISGETVAALRSRMEHE